jgi:AcrR family transcriptional regulator
MGNRPKLEHESAERILNTAWQLFQQKGYRGVTVDEICLQCSLTKPTLYYYFHDKEDLFVAVLTRELRRFKDVLEQPGSLEQHLQRMAAAVLDNFQTEYTVLLRDREHIKRPENQRAVRDAFRGSLFNPLNTLMQAGLQSGELQGRSPELLTLAFLGVVNNFINRSAELGTDTSTLAAELTQLFLKGASKS